MATQSQIHVSDVLNQASAAQMRFTDSNITGDCPKCQKPIPLNACLITQATETTYTCPKCGSILVIIGAPNPDGKPWQGRGYRLNDFVVRNAVDLRFPGLPLVIPRSPAALDKERKP